MVFLAASPPVSNPSLQHEAQLLINVRLQFSKYQKIVELETFRRHMHGVFVVWANAAWQWNPQVPAKMCALRCVRNQLCRGCQGSSLMTFQRQRKYASEFVFHNNDQALANKHILPSICHVVHAE
jgi:hypothetical protein